MWKVWKSQGEKFFQKQKNTNRQLHSGKGCLIRWHTPAKASGRGRGTFFRSLCWLAGRAMIQGKKPPAWERGFLLSFDGAATLK